MTPLAQAFQELLAALDRIEAMFVVVGSVASGAHGLARLTNDIDILLDLPGDRVGDLCDALRSQFYVDEDTVARAVEIGRAFNVIHLTSAYKFDLFPAGADAFARSELQRRAVTTGLAGLTGIEFPVATPEDTILAKLVWYRKGGEVSERQWSDILGMVKIQHDRLDRDYLTRWSETLGISDLLRQVLP